MSKSARGILLESREPHLAGGEQYDGKVAKTKMTKLCGLVGLNSLANAHIRRQTSSLLGWLHENVWLHPVHNQCWFGLARIVYQNTHIHNY